MADVELYPEERNAVISAWAAIQAKWGGQANSKQNMIAMATEAENRFKELGLIIIVDISNMEMADDGQLYHSPIISVEGRVDPEFKGHDFERHAYEVQHGYLDGVEGKIDPSGKMSEFTKKG